MSLVDVLTEKSVLRLDDLEGCRDRYKNPKGLGCLPFPVAVTKYLTKAA